MALRRKNFPSLGLERENVDCTTHITLTHAHHTVGIYMPHTTHYPPLSIANSQYLEGSGAAMLR